MAKGNLVTDKFVRRVRELDRSFGKRKPVTRQARSRKYPVGGGTRDSVFRLTADLVGSANADAIRQQWVNNAWEDKDATLHSLQAEFFPHSYYFANDIVLARKIRGEWEVVSEGTRTKAYTLVNRLVYGETDSGGTLTINADHTRDYYFPGQIVLVEFLSPVGGGAGQWQVKSPGFSSVRGVLDGDLASSGTATMSVYQNTGAGWSDTLDNLTVEPWSTTLSTTITAGTKVLAEQIGNGVWGAKIEECV